VPERPLVVAFDVVETLFPLGPLGERLARAGQSPDLLPVWFGQLLRDAFALTASGGYRPFAEVAIAALRTLAPVSEATAREVVGGFAGLDPHPDVAEAMQTLRAAEVRIITLTNGSAATTSTLLERAGVHGLVEHVVSVEAVRRWKPAPEPYRHATEVCEVPPERMAVVAAHGWDLHGARNAGLLTGWVNRSDGRWNDLFDPPDITGSDLVSVARSLVALNPS
jgi:2-haloacid dehalogenase